MTPSLSNIIRMRRGLCIAICLTGVFLVSALTAQETGLPLEPRVGKLESEMRAVQRKVFPGGSPKYFQPEVQTVPAPDASAGPATASPDAGVAELQVRIQGVEKQLADITGRLEQNENRTKQLEDQFAKFRADVESRLPVSVAPSISNPADAPAGVSQSQPAVQKPVKPLAPSPAVKTAGAKTPASQTTGVGPAETVYRAAYTSYTSKDYEQSEAGFKDFISRYPQHPLASNVEYWLGRTYINKKQYGQAARSFLQGYQKYPKGEKAPDSLLGLAESLIALDKSPDACSALSELSVVYPDASTSIKARQTSLHNKAKCK